MIRTILFGSALLAFAVGVAAQSNLLVNGSFEQGPPLTTSWMALQPGSGSLPGWTIVNSPIDLVGTYWQQADGQRSLDLDGNPGNGGVQQSFTTAPGQRYVVAFRMAGNCVGSPLIKALEVAAAGSAARFEFDIRGNNLQDMGWRDFTWSFVASGATTTLTVRSLTPTPGFCGPALDDVRVFPDGYITYGAGCAGNLAIAPSLWQAPGSAPSVGSRYFLEVRDVPAGAIPVGLLGWRQPVALDLTVVGAPGCALEVVILTIDVPPAPVAGKSVWPLDIPNQSSLVGVAVDQQAAILRLSVNPLGIVATNGGRFLIR